MKSKAKKKEKEEAVWPEGNDPQVGFLIRVMKLSSAAEGLRREKIFLRVELRIQAKNGASKALKNWVC